MPRISEFFGIVIAMYFDEGRHAVPHFHAEHDADVASVAFDGSIIVGSLSTRDARLVREWALAHQDELANNWSWRAAGSRWRALSRCPKILAMSAGRPKWIVRGVTVIGDHRLRLLFEDGTVGDISFEGRTWNGVLTPLNDHAYFARVQIANSSLYWAEDDLDLAPEPLYEAASAAAIAQPVAAAA